MLWGGEISQINYDIISLISIESPFLAKGFYLFYLNMCCFMSPSNFYAIAAIPPPFKHSHTCPPPVASICRRPSLKLI